MARLGRRQPFPPIIKNPGRQDLPLDHQIMILQNEALLIPQFTNETLTIPEFNTETLVSNDN